jgi:glycosyltransferase involved in cell wall biosynthesis
MPASSKKIVIVGPAHPLRGGLASYNERLAREFISHGHEVFVYTFSLQYPSFLFPGTSQYSSEPAPAGLNISICINSVNPLNWLRVGRKLKSLRPDIIVVRYWLPFMGPCLGTILRQAKKNKYSRIICIADNIIPHEKRPGDQSFTRYFVRPVDAFITMSKKVLQDLRLFEKTKPAEYVQHPLYDNFGESLSLQEARSHLGLPQQDKIILFFGFIRHYKGLDILLEAMALLKDTDIKLMVAGEFYEDEAPYLEKIKSLGLEEKLILRTHFISDSEVRYYICAANAVVQPYRSATQSGVTPLAYHFEKPMIVTDVGGLPDLVPDGKVGLVTKADPASLAATIRKYFETGEERFLPHLREEKKKYSWEIMMNNIIRLAENKAAS